MRLSDKLYEIIDKRYSKFWRTEGVPKGCYFGKNHRPINHSRADLIIKWHEMLRSNGMKTLINLMDDSVEVDSSVVYIKDPAILHNEWILVPNEIAMKIVVLGDLP